MTKTKAKSLDLATLLLRCHSSICRELKDRVIALLAMSSPRPRVLSKEDRVPGTYTSLKKGVTSAKISFDCSKSWLELYISVVKSYVETKETCTVLKHLIIFRSLYERRDSWPSWIPAWHLKALSCPHCSHDRYRPDSCMEGYDTVLEPTESLTLEIRGATYKIDGECFEKLQDAG